MAEDDTPSPRNQGRSPPYPFIGLEKALYRLASFYEQSKGHPIRVESIAEGWKYNPKSSGILQTVGALKGYGLIEDVSGYKERRLKIADLGKQLILAPPQNLRMRLLKEAALKPKAMKEFWEKWGANRPADNECKWELTAQRGFTPDAAATFLRVYDETISYAGLRDSDKIGDEVGEKLSADEGDLTDDVAPERSHMEHHTQEPKPAAVRQASSEPASYANIPGTRKAVFPLSEGDVVLTFPIDISEEGLAELGDYLDIFLKKTKRTLEAKSQSLNG